MKTTKLFAWILICSLFLSLIACNKATGITCPECDEKCAEDAAFCPECGEKLNQTVECKCGHENKAGSKFCSACGASLTGGNNKLDNDTNGDKGNNDPENNDPENNDPENNDPENNDPENNDPENNDPGNNDPGNNGQGDGEKEETPVDPAESIWLKVREQREDSSYYTEYYYDYDGLLTGYCNFSPNGRITEQIDYTYDEQGNMTSLSYFHYNGKGEMYSSGVYRYYNSYDEKGNLLSSQSSSGWKDEYAYDEYGNLILHKEFNGRGEVNDIREYIYDENGVLVEEIDRDSNDKYEYRYNENGWLTSIVLDGDAIQKFEYDEHGNVILELERGNIVVEESPDGLIVKPYLETKYQYMTLAEYRAQGLHESKPNATPGGSSQGGSGSGSSNQGTKCQYCKGGGIRECSGCDGKGLVLKYYISGAPVYGNCMACKGNGYIECPYCDGDGIFGN